MKKFFKPIVLAIIASSLAVVSCDQVKRDEVDGIKNELAALKEKVASGEVDVKAQIATLQNLLTAYKQEVDPKLKELQTQLNSQYAELSAADARLRNALDEAQASLTAKINKNSNDITATNKDLQAAIAEYKKLVAAAVADFEAAMEEFKKEQADVDAGQDAAIVAMLAQFEIYKSAIDKSIEEMQATAVALGVALGVVEGDLTELEGDVDALKKKVDANYAAALAYTDALKATVKATTDALAERIAANEAAIKKLNEETIPGLKDVIEALQTSIEGLEGNVAALEEKKLDKATYNEFIAEFMAWAVKVETNFTTINGSITTINGSIKTINETIAMLQNADASIRNQIQEINSTVARLDGNADVPGSVKNQIKALHDDILTHLNTLKTQIEGQIETLQGDVAKLQEAVEDINKEIVIIKGKITATETEIGVINGKITNINSQIAALEGKVGTAETDIAQLKQDKAALESKLTTLENTVAALESTLESRIKALETLTDSLKTDIDKANAAIAIINGKADTEGSIQYAVAQLSAAVNEQLDILRGKIQKNEEDIAKLQEEIGKLQQRIQSLVFVPQYQDLKFGIPFSTITDNTNSKSKAYNDPKEGFTVVYKVAPANLAKILAEKVNTAIANPELGSIFTFDIESGLKTRAGEENAPKLTIMKAEVDEKADENGKITFHLSHEGFDADKLAEYAISLRVDNDEYKVHVASEYVQTILQKAGISIVVDMHNIYKVKSDGTLDVLPIDGTAAADITANIAYTDGIAYAFLAGFELGAKLYENTEFKGLYTYSQLKAMGYDMPEQVTTASSVSGDECDLVSDLSKGAASTVSVKIVDGTNDNMIKTKKQIGKNKIYQFAFNDGLGTAAANTVFAQLKVGIAPHPGTLQLNIPYQMTWTYADDAIVDNLNKAGTWKKNYKRDSIEVLPTLNILEGVSVLNGSNKVFGLEVSDFENKTFTPSATVENIICDFDIAGFSKEKNTLALDTLQIKKRLGDSYTVKGTYGFAADPNAFISDVAATVYITTKDRITSDINIAIPEYKVTLLKSGEWHISGDDGYYTINSDDFSDKMMSAYVNQGIFDSEYTREKAFLGEFASITYPGRTGLSANFEVACTNPSTTTEGDETFKIQSINGEFSSSELHEVASNYENKEHSLTIETYVGQKVTFTWPISAHPNNTYKFNTVGLNTSDSSFSIADSKVWPNHAKITKANTELDLVKDTKIQVMTGTGGAGTIGYDDYNKEDIMLVPEFTLVAPSDGVTIEATDARFLSNVKYYGTAASVGVKSALYVLSGKTKFLVPNSDKMYVNNTSETVDVVRVNQFNPIADPVVTTGSANMHSTDTQTIPISMEDILGNDFYVNGAETKASNYDASVEDIFGTIKFTVYTVNGSDAVSGWSIATPKNPSSVQLHTESVAAGTYQVVVKAATQWKIYYYTITVTVS